MYLIKFIYIVQHRSFSSFVSRGLGVVVIISGCLKSQSRRFECVRLYAVNGTDSHGLQEQFLERMSPVGQ